MDTSKNFQRPDDNFDAHSLLVCSDHSVKILLPKHSPKILQNVLHEMHHSEYCGGISRKNQLLFRYFARLLPKLNMFKIVLTKDEINAEMPFIAQAMEETQDATLRNYLAKKYTKLMDINQKIFSTNEDANPNLKFLGIFSYDIRVRISLKFSSLINMISFG